jgi:hypothetical protein
LLPALLWACGKDKVEPNRRVQVRFTSQNLSTSLGAAAGYTLRQANAGVEISYGSVGDNGVAESPVWEVPSGSRIEIELGFENVEPNGTIRPAAGARLTGEILVDGVVTATAKLDNTTTFGNNSYLASTAQSNIR